MSIAADKRGADFGSVFPGVSGSDSIQTAKRIPDIAPDLQPHNIGAVKTEPIELTTADGFGFFNVFATPSFNFPFGRDNEVQDKTEDEKPTPAPTPAGGPTPVLEFTGIGVVLLIVGLVFFTRRT